MSCCKNDNSLVKIIHKVGFLVVLQTWIATFIIIAFTSGWWALCVLPAIFYFAYSAFVD